MPTPGTTDVVVLCAGLGKRLQPLTNTIPKALVPVAGKPLLAYHLEAMREVGIRRIILVVGYLEEKIREFVGDGSRFGFEVHYVRQNPPRGTGDAVVAAAPKLKSDLFVVLYADIFFLRMKSVWNALFAGDAPKIICAEVEDTSQFGRVESRHAPEGEILESILEKDGKHRPGRVNAGLLLLPKTIIEILEGQDCTKRGEIELPQAVEELSIHGTKVLVKEVKGWFDIGNLPALHSASQLAATVGENEG